MKKNITNKMTKNNLFISVVIPTYNRKNVVMRAVKSVLNQKKSSVKYEIIVSDDGSADGTAELFKKTDPHVKYYRSKINGGVNVARNKGILKAKGNYILFLDSDDEITPDCFQTLEKYHKSGKLHAVTVFGCAEVKTRKPMFKIEKEGMYSYKDWLAKEKIDGEFLHICSKKVFETDLFDEERFCFESFFWNRIIKKHGLFASPAILRLYYYDEANRVSKELLNIKSAEKRYDDFKQYLKRFDKDYEELNLKKQRADFYFKTGLFGILSGKEGRKFLKESLRIKFTLKTFSLSILSIFGTKITRFFYKIFLRFMNV